MFRKWMMGLPLAWSVLSLHAVQAQAPTLASADQRRAETRVLKAVKDPRVVAAVAKVRQELLANPATRPSVARALLDRALTLWLHSLAFYEAGGDTDRPTVSWSIDSTPHDWFGHHIPGSGAAGDNPDNIYLNSFINGGSSYEVSGRLPANGPVDFSIEVIRAEPGRFLLPDARIGEKKGNLGNQVQMLRQDDLKVGADGRFTVTLGPGSGEAGRVHVQTPSLPLEITYRNTLSDWRQSPVEVTIRRTDPAPSGAELSHDELATRIARDFPGWVDGWVKAKERWFGPANGLSPVKPRDGNWGLATGGRFDLKADEALVITTSSGGARYTGFVIFDSWYLGGDARHAITSINNAQAAPNPNGTVTYVISPRDPGVVNWLDASRSPEGYVGLRWQKATDPIDPVALVRDVRLMKLSDLPSVLPSGTPHVTQAERVRQQRQRARDYQRRLFADAK